MSHSLDFFVRLSVYTIFAFTAGLLPATPAALVVAPWPASGAAPLDVDGPTPPYSVWPPLGSWPPRPSCCGSLCWLLAPLLLWFTGSWSDSHSGGGIGLGGGGAAGCTFFFRGWGIGHGLGWYHGF
jgi:hypothetical protein